MLTLLETDILSVEVRVWSVSAYLVLCNLHDALTLLIVHRLSTERMQQKSETQTQFLSCIFCCRGLLAAAAEDDEGNGGAVNALMDSASAAGDQPEVLYIVTMC